MSHDQPYQVGKGRPPLHSRFQKGVCPNPAGRPKGSRNIASIIMKSLNEKVVITANGRRKSVAKLEAAAIQIANKAAAGDLKAISLAFELSREAETRLSRESTGQLSSDARRASDAVILAMLKASLSSRGGEAPEQGEADG